MNYVIIGNGIAGTCAAETIRQYDPEGRIAMLSDEQNAPYCRPMISLMLEGAVAPENLFIRTERFYDDLKIDALLGSRVDQIDVDNRTVVTQDEKRIAFDKLLIASGADPRPIKANGLDLMNIFYMRKAAHVRQMIEMLPKAKNALVLGGGLVGFKAAYSLIRRGLHVTMLIRSGFPLSMQVDETAGKMILDELVAQGLTVRTGAEVTEFEGRDAVSQARLSDGSVLPCDMVVIGKGVLPALSFVPGDRIEVDLGVRVNVHLETTTPGIFAAGDVAESIDIARKTPWVNAIWPEAVNQGRIAGANMAGRPVVYRGSLSRNVIRIFDMDVMTGGVVNPPADPAYEVIEAVNLRRKTYRKFVFLEDLLKGFVLVNSIEQGGILMSLVQQEMPVRFSKAEMLEPTFNFKKVMTS